MNTMIIHTLRFLSIFLSCITLSHVTTSVNSEWVVNTTDRVALQAFKSMIIHDPQGVLNSWNDTHHFCEWEGITCGHKHRRVIVLDLHSKGLVGSLSQYIGNLSFLREIDLSNNSIQGEIPPQVGHLFRLKILDVRNNSLAGEIPANLSHCTRLNVLFMGRNHLMGRIPPEFVYLSNLEMIALHFNKLTGGIPPFLGNLTSLKLISIAANDFGGNIPDSLGQLKKLTYLGLGANNLSGIVPPSIYNLSFLVQFTLTQNQLQGSLPPNLGHTLPRLELFEISENLFHGAIPESLSNASDLGVIEMANNFFSGKLAVDFGGMPYLEYLLLDFNNLTSKEDDGMRFINSLINCSNLLYLDLGRNQFRGPLPHSIANLSSKLQILYIDENQLYGTIPLGISNLVDLSLLYLQRNQFSGKIPKELGKLQSLEYLVLFDNKLIGEIPSSLGNMSQLNELSLYINRLSGVIPPSLSDLKQLKTLDLSHNDLNGTIPNQIFDITSLAILLNLAHNQLIGSIPTNIGNLKGLSIFDLSFNKLSGEIPNTLSLCSSLEYLYLTNNFFQGHVPLSLGSLRGIRYINLSHNNLSGQIPKFFETLALEYLDLSFDDLEGAVPTKGIFANASAFSIVGNSDRLCGGIAELHLPKCASNEAKKGKISQIVKILLSITSTFLGLAMMFLIFYWLKKKRGEQPFINESVLIKELLKVSYERLHKATDGFSSRHLIGVGSFGSVYKGILDQNRTIVAIKVLNLERHGASKSFMTECKVLQNIRHKNLLKVITSCSSIDFQGNDFKAIVYEYMSNGSLEKWLYPSRETMEEQLEVHNLTLVQRVNIAIDVASALDYLHHHCQEPILHCDLKPSNVLLNTEMTAHVGDFGLARFLPKMSNPNQSSSVGVRGSIGYAAPEYGVGNEVSANGDVYSYGILLLEMITSKRPTDVRFEEGLNLHNFARMALPEKVMDIVDPTLLDYDNNMRETNSKKECLISMIRIGVACSMELPQDRMNIKDVIQELQRAKKIIFQPRALLN